MPHFACLAANETTAFNRTGEVLANVEMFKVKWRDASVQSSQTARCCAK